MKDPRDSTDQPGGNANSPGSKSGLARRQLITTMGSAATYLGLLPLAGAEQRAQVSSSRTPQAGGPAPVPIPGGFNARQAFGPRFPDRFFHLFLPGPGGEPSTLFNFQGKVAILNIHGTGLRSEFDPATGELVSQTPHLPFAADVRFMQGTYVGVDRQQHQATFAFFRMDVFQAGHQFGDYDFQLNDHNPGVSDGGVFWTVPIPNDAVSLNLAAGTAAFALSDILMPDLHDLLTALWGGGALDGEGMPLHPVFSSTVSLQARWFNPTNVQQTRDPVNQFVYDNARTNASIRWSSVRRGVRFTSDDDGQQVIFAATGMESNGVFF